ncbi:MAG: cell surface glycoprotein (s-layer protein) related protein-like protein [Candidatus Solibacter sp.]|nr:cell surface glycoprotein (s-layer protein) related protein-like protein [Candidatus Solibacter sp.]
MAPIPRLALFLCAAPLFAAPTPSKTPSAMARLPLRFEENRGQNRPDVRFTAHSVGGNLQLTDRGPAFLVGARPVEISLVHGNAKPTIEPLDPLPTVTNYMVGARAGWRSGIGNFARVRYRGVYPGIDAVYYGTNNQLEYDFVLAPGADPDAIRLKFTGDIRLSLTADGDLSLESDGAQMLQKAPAIFQDTRRIQGRYTLLSANEVGFRIARYDRTRPLTIDPILVYCTYIGTTGADQVTAIKLAANGLLYVTGTTNTGEFSTIDGAYSDHNLGLTDVFLAIIDPSANANFALKYFSYFGGAGLDVPLGIDVDSKGVAYLTGTTTSVDMKMVGSSVSTAPSATSVLAFVAVIDPALYGGDSLVYSTYLGGTTGNNSGNGIVVDKDGFIYLIGTTKASDFPVTTSAYAGVLYGNQDAFLCKIDPNSSSMPYSTYLGGELSDDGRAIAVGTNGMVYFAASTVSTQFPMEGPGYRQNLNGAEDIIIGMMDMTKFGTPSLVYSTYFGGSDLEEVRAMTLDAKNNVVVTGYTLSSDLVVTGDAVQRNPGGNGDAFVAVCNPLDPPRFLVYSTYFGGSEGEVSYAVKTDSAGNIYIAGYTISPNLFTVAAPQPGWGQGIDAFVAEIKPGVAGRAGILFSTYIGLGSTYVANSLAVGADGSIYVGGYGNIGLPNTDPLGFHGGTSDGFLIVYK